VKIQHRTLFTGKRKWFLIGLLFVFITYFFCERSTLSENRNLRPEIGTRGLGLSGAFVSSADDATSALWNPAGLATLDRGNLIYDFSQGAFSFAYPVKPIGTFGLNILDFNRSDRFLAEHASNPIGTFELGNNQVLLSYARRFGPIQLGANTGYSRAPYQGSLWAPNYDLGVLAKPNPYLVLGIRFRDISGVPIRHKDGGVLQVFDPQFDLGITLIPHSVIRWHNRFHVTSPGFGTSLEIATGPISARVGSTFSFDAENPTHSWSLGFSLDGLGKQTHYTYLNQDDLKHKHLFSIGITFDGMQLIPQHPSSPKTAPNAEISQSTSQKPGSEKEGSKTNFSKYTSVQIAKQYDIDISLLLAIVYVESNFNPIAVSKSGAGGLMQIVPETARELGLKVPRYANRIKPNLDPKVDERFDPQKNLHAGLTYFNKLLNKYIGDLTLALGAYNVGPGKVRVRGPLISRGRKYAKKVLARSALYRNNATQMEVDVKKLEAVLNK